MRDKRIRYLMHQILTILTCAILTCALASRTVADVPSLINYQGQLTDTNRLPLTGTHQLTFSVYDVPAGGAPLWVETQNGIFLDSNGIFNVLLGSINALQDTLFLGANRYLGVMIDAGSELSPRYRFTSVPYALNAKDSGSGDTYIFYVNDRRIINSGNLIAPLTPTKYNYIALDTTVPAWTFRDYMTVQSCAVASHNGGGCGQLVGYITINGVRQQVYTSGLDVRTTSGENVSSFISATVTKANVNFGQPVTVKIEFDYLRFYSGSATTLAIGLSGLTIAGR